MIRYEKAKLVTAFYQYLIRRSPGSCSKVGSLSLANLRMGFKSGTFRFHDNALTHYDRKNGKFYVQFLEKRWKIIPCSAIFASIVVLEVN